MTKVGVSILSADYMNFTTELKSINQSGAEYLHLDIMDGHFVPNMTFGPEMVRQMSRECSLPLDVHLMIEKPERFIKEFAEAGAEIITVHYEACLDNLDEVLSSIKEHGCKPGIAINPDTSAEKIKKYISEIDLILQMTVFPGFGGQKFIESTLDNIKQLSKWREEENLSYMIEVDGGINFSTAADCVNSGVDLLVAGSFFIDSDNKNELVKELQEQI